MNQIWGHSPGSLLFLLPFGKGLMLDFQQTGGASQQVSDSWPQNSPCSFPCSKDTSSGSSKGPDGVCRLLPTSCLLLLVLCFSLPSSDSRVSMHVYIFRAIRVPLPRDLVFTREMAFHGHTAMLKSSAPRSQGISWMF